MLKKKNVKRVTSLIFLFIFIFNNIGISNASIQKPSNTNPNHYLIGINKDIDLDSFVTKKGWKSKVQRKAKSINTIITDLNLDEVNSLKNDPDIAFIEEDVPIKTAAIGKVLKDYPDVKNLKKDSETIPWGLRAIGANLSLEHKYNGNAISIAVLDTGIAKHPDLKVKGGVSFVDGITSYVDDNGHGTHVAGTIAAQENKFGVVGVAPKSDIYAVKVLDQDGSGSYSQVIEGIEWAIDQKVNIISMSFGGLQDSKALHDIITIANNKGILLVAAAGNRGLGDETEIYPALYPEVISVGAVAQNDKRASYSSTGAELDLVAPGTSILSTTSDGEYGVMSGTSMAVPHVTGSAAVLWSDNKKLSSAAIKSMIYQSATPIGEVHDYGHGKLNLAKALKLVNGAIPPIINSVDDPLNRTDKPIPSFDSKSKDIQFGAFKDKLLMLKQMAIDSNKLSIAKEIDRKYNELLVSDISLSKLPEELQKTSKDLSLASNIESQINSYYQTKASQIRALEYEYQQAIADFSGQITNINLAATFVTGDMYLNAPQDFDSTQAPGWEFTMRFTPTSTGTYQILTGPFGGTGSSNDTYLELYTDSGLTNMIAYDDDSAGNRFSKITTTLNAGNIYYIKLRPYSSAGTLHCRMTVTMTTPPAQTITINSPVDVSLTTGAFQVFSFTPSSTGTYQILTGPYGGTGSSNDTYLELYSDASLTNMITYDDDSGGNSFSKLSTNLNSGSAYYIKLRPYSSYGAVQARLTVSMSAPPAQIITLNSPIDVDLATGAFKVFQFTPTSTGAYQLLTGPYGGTGISNDTYLELYTDPNLTNMIAYDDDSAGNAFSKLSTNLNAGVAYYIKMRHYSSSGAVHARISVSKFITIQTINSDTPVDVQVNQGSYQTFAFTPNISGEYKMDTSPFGGNGGSSDTYLELYNDPNLTNLLTYNDDGNGNYYSEMLYSLNAGSTYYIKFKGYADNAASGRLIVTQIYDWYYVGITDNTGQLIKKLYVSNKTDGTPQETKILDLRTNWEDTYAYVNDTSCISQEIFTTSQDVTS